MVQRLANGYNLNHQVASALMQLHRADVDGVRLACLFKKPVADALETAANAATLVVDLQDIDGDAPKTRVRVGTEVGNIQAPYADPGVFYTVKGIERRSSGFGYLTLEKQAVEPPAVA